MKPKKKLAWDKKVSEKKKDHNYNRSMDIFQRRQTLNLMRSNSRIRSKQTSKETSPVTSNTSDEFESDSNSDGTITMNLKDLGKMEKQLTNDEKIANRYKRNLFSRYVGDMISSKEHFEAAKQLQDIDNFKMEQRKKVKNVLKMQELFTKGDQIKKIEKEVDKKIYKHEALSN